MFKEFETKISVTYSNICKKIKYIETLKLVVDDCNTLNQFDFTKTVFTTNAC